VLEVTVCVRAGRWEGGDPRSGPGGYEGGHAGSDHTAHHPTVLDTQRAALRGCSCRSGPGHRAEVQDATDLGDDVRTGLAVGRADGGMTHAHADVGGLHGR
jgi:hypothetical protein